MHFALGLQLFAVQEACARHAVKREPVAFLGVRELPVGITFDFLPQVLVSGAVIAKVSVREANRFRGDKQVVVNQRNNRAELCHAGVTSPDKVNEQVRGNVEDKHRNCGFFHVETVIRAVPLAKQSVNDVGQREHERKHHELQVRYRQIVRNIIVEHDNRRRVLVSIHKSESQVAAQESLGFVIQKGQEQNCGMENGIEYCGDFHDDRFGCCLAGGNPVNDATQNQEHHEGVHNPHEIDTHGVENEPVRLRDKRESVRVAAEQEQYAE